MGVVTVLSLSLTAQDFPFMDEVIRGDNLRAESKFDSALSVLQRANLKAVEANNVEFLARTHIGIGSVYVELKDLDVAIENYLQALSFARQIDSKKLENRALFGLGVAHQVEGNLDSALYYYDITRQSAIELGDTTIASTMLGNMSSIHSKRGENEQAIDKIRESLEINQQLKDNRAIGRNFRMIGIIYRRINSYDSSKFYLEKALVIADSLGFLDDEIQVYSDMAYLYKEQGDYKSAYESMREFSDQSRKIYSEENNEKLMELRTQFNTESLELRNQLQENQILAQKRSKLIILIIGISLLVIISIWLYIVDQRRKTIKALAAKNDEINKQKIDELLQQQEIASLQGVLEGQETERKRVAIDLHDRLGGILSMVKLHFSAVEEKIDSSNPTKEKFLTASELLDLAAGEVRNISHNMMSGVLAKFGLVPALEDLKSRISETGKLQVNLYTSNINGSLDGEQELQLYRIVQELMSNILKHAEATETNIQLNENEDSVNLIVEDDGVGFNPQKLDVNAGIGLSNLKARVSKLNGTLHIDSGLGAGTTISIDIPIEND